MNRAQRYKKGQVWMVREDHRISNAKIDSGDGSLAKNRPWLIVEADESIEDNPIRVWCMPISSQIGSVRESDILFTNGVGATNRLITSELETKSTSLFLAYMFTMPDELMFEVDVYMAKRLGFGSILKKLDVELQGFESRVHNIEDRALAVMSAIHSLEVKEAKKKETVKESKNIVTAPVMAAPFKQEILPDVAIVNSTIKKESVSKSTKPKNMVNTNRSWSLDDYSVIVENTNKLTQHEIAEMYDLTLNNLHKIKYYLKKKFGTVMK